MKVETRLQVKTRRKCAELNITEENIAEEMKLDLSLKPAKGNGMVMSAAARRVRVFRVHLCLYLPSNSRTPRQGIRSAGLMRTREEI